MCPGSYRSGIATLAVNPGQAGSRIPPPVTQECCVQSHVLYYYYSPPHPHPFFTDKYHMVRAQVCFVGSCISSACSVERISSHYIVLFSCFPIYVLVCERTLCFSLNNISFASFLLPGLLETPSASVSKLGSNTLS